MVLDALQTQTLQGKSGKANVAAPVSVLVSRFRLTAALREGHFGAYCERPG